jgi:hypothetical protein
VENVEEGGSYASDYARVLMALMGTAPPDVRTVVRDRVAGALHRQMPGCTHDEHGGDCVVLADAVLEDMAGIRGERGRAG